MSSRGRSHLGETLCTHSPRFYRSSNNALPRCEFLDILYRICPQQCARTPRLLPVPSRASRRPPGYRSPGARGRQDCSHGWFWYERTTLPTPLATVGRGPVLAGLARSSHSREGSGKPPPKWHRSPGLSSSSSSFAKETPHALAGFHLYPHLFFHGRSLVDVHRANPAGPETLWCVVFHIPVLPKLGEVGK